MKEIEPMNMQEMKAIPNPIDLDEKAPQKNDAAKQRVVEELDELLERVTKLIKFAYSTKPAEQGLSRSMVSAMKNQARIMIEYANELQHRLSIWDKSETEIQYKY